VLSLTLTRLIHACVCLYWCFIAVGDYFDIKPLLFKRCERSSQNRNMGESHGRENQLGPNAIDLKVWALVLAGMPCWALSQLTNVGRLVRLDIIRLFSLVVGVLAALGNHIGKHLVAPLTLVSRRNS